MKKIMFGGIVGYLNMGIIENSHNNSNITVMDAEGKVQLGGISWHSDSVPSVPATIKNSSNKGNIKGFSNGNDVYIGGVLGYSEAGSQVIDSINNGILTANAGTGTLYKNNLIGFQK